MMSQELLTQETRISCQYGRQHPDRARRHVEATVTGGQFFCAASSWTAIESHGHAINPEQQQVILRKAAKERLRGRRMSVHHRWVTYFWKKLQVRKWHSLETLQAYSLDISSLPWPKKDSPQDTKKNSLCKTFVYFFGDFSTWNASIGVVNHFLVSLIVVRHLFQCKATSETHQKWIQKGIKKNSLQNLVAWHLDNPPPPKKKTQLPKQVLNWKLHTW